MATAEGKLRELGETAVERVERQEWLEPLAERLQRAVIAAYEVGGERGRRIRDWLHGTWLGHPLHPVLTDVPLGAWTVTAVLDLFGNHRSSVRNRAADTALGVGLAGAVGAAVNGLTDWQHTSDDDRRAGLVHGMLNGSATLLYALSLAFRMHGDRRAGRATAGVGFALVLGAAYLGGHLVYRRKLGVDRAPRVEWDDFMAVLPESELGESAPRRVEARGVSIVLVKRRGTIRALAETCAHLGGPLSEGQVDD